MRLPIHPPDWVGSLDEPKVLLAQRNPDVARVIRQANYRYWHWDKFRYRPVPDGWTHEELWAAIKFSRSTQTRQFGMRAADGSPFWFWLPEMAQRELHEIDKHLGGHLGVDYPGITPRDRDRYLISSLMEEAIASSQIEGAATTRKVAKEMLRKKRPPRTHGERMIANNYTTIQMLRTLKNQPLSPDMVIEIQREITAETLENPLDSGRVRTSDEVRVVDEYGEIIHTPPPVEELGARLEAMCQFANESSETSFIHPVVKAILLHFWLGYDHPFADGNGRTARSLFYWCMLRHGYWLFEFLPISRIINRAPVQYSRAYSYAETDENDATYFIAFNLRAIRRALDDLREYLRRQQEKSREVVDFLKRLRGVNHRQSALLQSMVREKRQSVTIEEYRSLFSVSYGTANTDLATLYKRKFLDRAKQGRQWVYFPADDLPNRLKKLSQK